MPDTLVDPPPPPTLPDGPTEEMLETLAEPPFETPQPPQPGAAPPRRRRAALLVAAAALLVGALLGGLGFYFLFWRGAADARTHVPDRASFVARFDAREIALFSPVRKHLWPVLLGDDGAPTKPAPSKAAGPTRAQRIEKATGIRAIDVREVVIASTDANSWVMLIGGNLRPGRAVPGLLEVMQQEGSTGWAMAGEMLTGPGGLAVAQAEDGTLILATDAEVARAALPPTEQWRELELPAAPAAFTLSGDAWRAFSSRMAAAPRADVLGRIEHGSGTLRLGDAPEVELRLRPGTGDAATVAADVDALLSGLRLGLLLAPDRYGEKQALAAAKVTTEANRVVLRAPWPMEGLDRICQELAGRLRERGSPSP